MRWYWWWEPLFPMTAAALVLWATLEDLPHLCGGLWEWSLFCGIGWIFRLDVIVPLFPLWIWALARSLYR